MIRKKDSSQAARRIRLSVWFLALLGAVFLIAMTLAAPLVRERSPSLSAFLYAIFAPLCHQLPSRCFHLHGYSIAVCARCLGIYAGFLLGCVLFPFFGGLSKPVLPPVRLLLFLALPACVDFAGNGLGLWHSSMSFRFATGLMAGGISPFFFIEGVSEAFSHRPNRMNAPGQPPGKP